MIATPGNNQKKKRRSTAPTPALEHLASSIRMSIRAAPGEKIPDGNPAALKRASTVKSMVVANDQRPLDMISLRSYISFPNPYAHYPSIVTLIYRFLANDDYIVTCI